MSRDCEICGGDCSDANMDAKERMRERLETLTRKWGIK